jgi:hypothetical protein
MRYFNKAKQLRLTPCWLRCNASGDDVTEK